MTTTETPPRPAPGKRRTKRVRRLVIALVVLVGLLVVADFGAAAIFEYQVSKRARDQFDLSDDPAVKVGGFSFLAQAISGEYGHVTIDAKGVPVEDTLRDLEVHIELRDVQAPLGDLGSGSLQEVKVREVEGQVKVKASDVNRAIASNRNNLIRSITNVQIDPISEQDAITDPDSRTDAEQEAAERAAEAEIEDTTAGARVCATANIGGDETEMCAYGIISLVEGAKMMPYAHISVSSPPMLAVAQTRAPAVVSSISASAARSAASCSASVRESGSVIASCSLIGSIFTFVMDRIRLFLLLAMARLTSEALTLTWPSPSRTLTSCSEPDTRSPSGACTSRSSMCTSRSRRVSSTGTPLASIVTCPYSPEMAWARNEKPPTFTAGSSERSNWSRARLDTWYSNIAAAPKSATTSSPTRTTRAMTSLRTLLVRRFPGAGRGGVSVVVMATNDPGRWEDRPYRGACAVVVTLRSCFCGSQESHECPKFTLSLVESCYTCVTTRTYPGHTGYSREKPRSVSREAGPHEPRPAAAHRGPNAGLCRAITHVVAPPRAHPGARGHGFARSRIQGRGSRRRADRPRGRQEPVPPAHVRRRQRAGHRHRQ